MAASALSTVTELVAVLDEDVREYLAGMLADANIISVKDVQESAGPFLESSGVDEGKVPALCTKIYDALVAAGVVKPPKVVTKPTSTKAALKAAAVAGSSRKAVMAGPGSDIFVAALGGVEEEDAGSAKLLAAPVKLGAKSVDSSAVDFMWGKENNSYLNQNTSFDYLEAGDPKASKKAAREAKKEESRAKFEKAKAEAAAAADAAAAAAEGMVSSGTVSYVLTDVRKAQDIAISSFNMGYGGELLLEGADLRITSGRRYAIVGRNGMGKSTLLRHMARADIDGAGGQRFPRNIRVLHVEQEITGTDATVLDTVLGADVERTMLLAEEAKLVAFVSGGATGDDAAAGTSASASSSSSSSSSAASTVSAVTATSSSSSSSKDGKGSVTAVGGAGASSSSADDDALSTATSSLSLSSGMTGGGGAAGGAAATTTTTAASPLTIDAANARLIEIAGRLEAIDASSAESRAAAILNGLGFTADMHAWPTKNLSGGWRMRVALACALFMEPDLLLLDEPTNHIDAKSLLWLVGYLIEYPHTLAVVSHDRWFLNQVCTDVVHLFNKKLDYYKGDYDTFERTRAEKRRHSEKAMENQEAKRAHVQAFIDKFRYNAKRASLVQSRIKALERMEVLEEVEDDPKWKFEFPDPGPLGIPVLQISDVTFGYRADKPLFRDVNFSVDTSSRIAIVGPNGVGKSTLLKLILGELEAQSGAVVRNSKLRIACFTQHHVNQLDLTLTALDFTLKMFPGSKPDAARAHLSSFGIQGDLALQRMGTMSGGQKSRVAFAVLTWKKPHVVVLDEPTNNLDLETIDAVIVALANFNGGLIVVSHDQHFVESVCDEIYVVGTPASRITKFAGEFKDYRKVAEREKPFVVGEGGADE